ncbi:primase zinc finger protein [Rutstroemia sp. NJR-2017a BVV2]|nr:primase zinc finger protein [Rutstroemia sp. NJR-2017a BVV2]
MEDMGTNDDDDDDEDEDEEMLQLQLQEIQARIRLKKLQKKPRQASDSENENAKPVVVRADSAANSRTSSRVAGERTTSEIVEAFREKRAEQEKIALQRRNSRAQINVPASPPRRVQSTELPRSPGRVLLGIDKGLKGTDISLKRAPGLRKNLEKEFQDTRRTGPFLHRANSQIGIRAPSQNSSQEGRPKSFNERMTTLRALDTEREERDARIRLKRSSAFDIGSKQMEAFKDNAIELPHLPAPTKEFSRDEVLNSYNRTDGDLTRRKTTSNLRSAMKNGNETTTSTGPGSQDGVKYLQSSRRNGGDKAASIRPSSQDEATYLQSRRNSTETTTSTGANSQSSFDKSTTLRPAVRIGMETKVSTRPSSQSSFDGVTYLHSARRNSADITASAKPVSQSFDGATTLRSALRNSIERAASTRPSSQSSSDGSTKLRSAMKSGTEAPTSARLGTQPSFDGLAKTRSRVELAEPEPSQFEPYSSTHLSKRIIPHQALTRTLRGKKTFTLPDLLKTVKAPDFSGPDIEQDVVVFATIAAKSAPRLHQNQSQNNGKFIVLTLTDLKWEVDLFLFKGAFEKFWKLTPGTVIALLNPGFMAPPRGKTDTGKFSLTLNSSEDTLLEIGTARDLGYCKSIKKDGKTCDSWVDKRHTEFCDYHVNLSLTKTHASRMEVNTMNFGPKRTYTGSGASGSHNSRDMASYQKKREDEKMREKTRYDRESHSQIYIGKRSAVNLLDDVDFDPDAFHRGSSKEERLTKQLLAQEKERELGRRLGMMGGGLGADYMKRRNQTLPNKQQTEGNRSREPTPPPDSRTLGLSGRGTNVQLSPVHKRKRANTISSSFSSTDSAPIVAQPTKSSMRNPSAGLGWGNNLSKELTNMREGRTLMKQRETKEMAPPVKKKTRFVTDKGIREAGRESIGGELVESMIGGANDNDDDDDLWIVME